MSIGSKITRRSVLKSGAAAAAGLAAPSILPVSAFGAGRITVADPGGPYGPAFREAFYDPFTEATGVEVVNVARQANPLADFKASVETKSYIWDVCHISKSVRESLAMAGLLEPIEAPSDLSASFMPEAITEDWVGTDAYATTLAFRTDRGGAKSPASWADFWNVEEFPGRRALARSPFNTLEAALLADGVPADSIYPMDIDRAFASLDKIKPHIAVWWTNGAESAQLLQSREVDMLSIYNARVQEIIDAGEPAEICWKDAILGLEGWSLPKGGPQTEIGLEFVKFCMAPERQAVFTKNLAYGPVNLKSYELITPEIASRLPTSPDHIKQSVVVNSGWWGPQAPGLLERFTQWILS